MPSAPNVPDDPNDPNPSGTAREFETLLDAAKSIINNVPDRYHQCAMGLKEVEMTVGAQGRRLLADMKAHPQNTAADNQKLAKLAITLGNALANYAKCIHTLPVRLT